MTSAFELWRIGFARMLDAVGVALLIWLGWQVMFGGSQPFETEALWVGGIGAVACLVSPGARRGLPLSMVAFVAVAVVSAAVHRRPAADPGWWLVLAPAAPLITMAAFVFGVAYFLRAPMRISWLAVLLVGSICVLASQIVFDRASTNFVYSRMGSGQLPDVAQWGGLHQTGMLLVLAFPFPLALVLFGRSLGQRAAGLILGGAILLVAVINNSTGGIVAMVATAGAMVACLVGQRVSTRWRAAMVAAVVVVLAVFFFAVSTGRVPLVAHGDLAGRVPIWRAAMAIWQDHPWLGAGPGGYPLAMLGEGYAQRFLPEGSGGTEQAHNLVLQVGAEMGIAGVLCLLGWWVSMLGACWRAWLSGHLPMLAYGLLFALGGFLIRSMSDNFLDGLVTTDRTRVLIWVLFAAALALDRSSRRSSRVEG